MKNTDYQEKTELANKYFPFNIFNPSSRDRNVINLHWHDNMEIIYLTKGNGLFTIGGETIEAKSGDILFVNRGELHTGYSINNTLLECNAIVFNPSLLSYDEHNPFYARYIGPYRDGRMLFPHKIDREEHWYHDVKSPIEMILREFKEQESGNEIMILQGLMSILIQLSRSQHCQLVEEKLTEDDPRTIFQPLFMYIADHYQERITLKQGAAIVNLSPYYFCRLFKKTTGKTFTEYINIYRINEAERLLRETKETVTSVAELTGFCSINYFDKVFRSIKNYSPSQCRREHR